MKLAVIRSQVIRNPIYRIGYAFDGNGCKKKVGWIDLTVCGERSARYQIITRPADVWNDVWSLNSSQRRIL